MPLYSRGHCGTEMANPIFIGGAVVHRTFPTRSELTSRVRRDFPWKSDRRSLTPSDMLPRAFKVDRRSALGLGSVELLPCQRHYTDVE